VTSGKLNPIGRIPVSGSLRQDKLWEAGSCLARWIPDIQYTNGSHAASSQLDHEK